jgi:hypothetical protein
MVINCSLMLIAGICGLYIFIELAGFHVINQPSVLTLQVLKTGLKLQTALYSCQLCHGVQGCKVDRCFTIVDLSGTC